MQITITIKFNSPAGMVTKGGTFHLKGKTPERVAFDWLNEIKRQVHYEGLVEVKVDDNENITEMVRLMEKAQLLDNK